jgi:predicted alpha/beta-hydrolase family hydrolase
MNDVREFRDDANGVPVRGFLHTPAAPGADCIVLTHGAGANCNSPLLVALANAFCAAGFAVLRCDLPFRQSRPHGPPHPSGAERDREGLRAAIASMRQQNSARMFLGGHSYGGRQASMLCAAEPGLVEALLLLSYPLHPPQRPQQLRTGHFAQLQTAAMFVHGVRDGFGSIDELTTALKLIPARTQLLPIDAAGHELLMKHNRDEMPNQVVAAFQSFA